MEGQMEVHDSPYWSALSPLFGDRPLSPVLTSLSSWTPAAAYRVCLIPSTGPVFILQDNSETGSRTESYGHGVLTDTQCC